MLLKIKNTTLNIYLTEEKEVEIKLKESLTFGKMFLHKTKY